MNKKIAYIVIIFLLSVSNISFGQSKEIVTFEQLAINYFIDSLLGKDFVGEYDNKPFILLAKKELGWITINNGLFDYCYRDYRHISLEERSNAQKIHGKLPKEYFLINDIQIKPAKMLKLRLSLMDKLFRKKITYVLQTYRAIAYKPNTCMVHILIRGFTLETNYYIEFDLVDKKIIRCCRSGVIS